MNNTKWRLGRKWNDHVFYALRTFFICCGILLILLIHFHLLPITH